jgi:hypothetical protein
MTPRTKRTLLFGGGFVALVALIYIVDTAEDWVQHVSYPFDVWRMDLDDALANVGLFLAGLGAFLAVFRKADRAHKRADLVSEQFNGGMREMAKQHVELATQEAQEAGHYIDLLTRVTTIEKQRDDCEAERQELREWINKRLDETGNGRSNGR